MKLYGFSKIYAFPCICYGNKGYFFSIAWGKKDKRFHVYKGHVTAEDIIDGNQNTYPKWWFVGFMINNSSKSYIEYNSRCKEE